jgi:hypothetical protein
MGYKLNVRDSSNWKNILKDLYIEINNTNWTSTTLSGFLSEIHLALDGKKSRNVIKTLFDYTAKAFDIILVDSSNEVIITLPITATRGDEIYITDVTGGASSNNITVNRNSHRINALDEDLVMDVDMCSTKLIYDNITNGWHIDVGGSYFGGDVSSFTSPFITLNSDFTTGTPTEDGGIIVKRGDDDDAIIRWNETLNYWELTNDGTTFSKILTYADLSTTLDDRYINATTDDTMTGVLTFNPAIAGAPFVIGANATGILVPGLNAQYSNGIMFSTITQNPSGNTASGDIWFQLV